jgi:cyclopropane-fatty-acyl-phospholipid synthase
MNFDLILNVGLASLIAMFAGFLYQVKTKNAGIVDAIWSFGVLLAAVYYAIAADGETEIRYLVGILTSLWFLRLGMHIFLRVLSEPEDGRYAYVRRLYGKKVNVFHAIFFILQAGFIVIFSLPIWFVAHHPDPQTWAMIAGVLIIAVAFIGEYQADHQLHLFRQDPDNKGKTCRQGLWKYSRHPNYFFEWCHWVAYPVMAIGMPYAAWLWLSPVIAYLFLRYLTGLPFTEMQALRSRGKDYEDYQATTSAFFPWPPNKSL